MNNQDYSCTITVNTSPAEAFEKIKQADKWWAEHVEGSCQQLHDQFTVRFGQTFGTFEITEIVENSRMVWKVIDGYLHLFANKHDWHGTSIIWDVAAIDNGATVTMTHKGLVPGKECYNDCYGGWNFYIQQSLFTLLNGEGGKPGTGIRTYILREGRMYEGLLYPKESALPDYAEGYILVDVKEIKGEHVISAYSAEVVHGENFDNNRLKGEQYMLIENKQWFDNIGPLEDIMQITGRG